MSIAKWRQKQYRAIAANDEQRKITELNKQPKNKVKEKERIKNPKK